MIRLVDVTGVSGLLSAALLSFACGGEVFQAPLRDKKAARLVGPAPLAGRARTWVGPNPSGQRELARGGMRQPRTAVDPVPSARASAALAVPQPWLDPAADPAWAA